MPEPIRIYNTFTQKKEEFIPLREGRVGMYVCGVTVYDHAHIGHARAAVIFDVIYRYLQHRGYNVTYVRNFTDVDDKIINRANKEGKSWKEIAETFIRDYTEDMRALNVTPPTYEPLATDHISEMINLVSSLIDRGYAYELDGDVYFSVEKFSDYGKLSKKNIDEQLAGARVETDERKQDPRDFALWKKSKPNEPSWPSPWGPGRPGWHIECSAMSQKYLGKTLDIHGGGRDLIFPHHENEQAQSEASTGAPFVRYWIHNGFVNINSEKMSKSLGNIFAIKDILREYHPEVVRLFLLSHHYRSPVDFSPEIMKEVESGIERIYTTLADIDALIGDLTCPPVNPGEFTGLERDIYEEIAAMPERFEESMDDDFNTAQCIGNLYHVVRALNRYLTDKKFKKTDQAITILEEARNHVACIGTVLGLFQTPPAEYLAMVRTKKLATLDISAEEIERLVEERAQARKAKEWARADQIRNSLMQKGITLEDKKDATTWTVI